MTIKGSLKILAFAAMASTSVAAFGAPATFLPAAIEHARVDGSEAAATMPGQAKMTLAFVRTFSPDPRLCTIMKAGKLAGRPGAVRAPECAFPILL